MPAAGRGSTFLPFYSNEMSANQLCLKRNFDIEVLNTVRVVSDSCLHCRFCVAVSFDDAWSGELLRQVYRRIRV